MSNPVADFYTAIADHYDAQFHDETDEDRQDDLDDVAEQVSELMRGHTVLELGCGTGYFTDVIAETAQSVLATDISEAMLNVAREHGEGLENVQYRVVDALQLPTDLGKFTAVFAGFLWSHFKKEEQDAFLEHTAHCGFRHVWCFLADELGVFASAHEPRRGHRARG